MKPDAPEKVPLMSISQHELGRRLRTAREACHLTQDDVARHLHLSRSSIVQMEFGNRAVTSLELDRLAYLFGRDIRELLAEDFQEDDALVAFFRRHPDVAQHAEVVEALRTCLALGREVTNLEHLLGMHPDPGLLPAYPVPGPRSKWDAVQQGRYLAEDERRRLSLGTAPLTTVADLLATQGVRTAQVDLPEDISGLMLCEPHVGPFVVANRQHHVLRRRFSYAHEYAHVLLDRERRGTISRTSERDHLLEVRANAFAAHVLMPDAGVHQFLASLGKGRPGRQQAEVFDESGVVYALARAQPQSQEVQMYDVVLLAQHFGTSRLTALYRLRNLGYLTAGELAHLTEQEAAGVGKEVAAVLALPEINHEAARHTFRQRFVRLALEAWRRDKITRAKLVELAGMVEVGSTDLTHVLQDVALDDQEEAGDVVLPGE
jgi:Zn-dependent peptidase ImmA (M78 family)/transcriptional regulator with XRE-family HTH domain